MARRSLVGWFHSVGREVPAEELSGWLGEMAPERPVWNEEKRAWLVPGYRDVRSIGLDHELWRSPLVPPDEEPLSDEWQRYLRFEGVKKIVTLRYEEHDRLHRWWMKMFSERRLARFRETIFLPVVDGAIDAFVDRGRAELVDELADRVALPINLQMMGIPASDEFEAAWTKLIERHFTARTVLLKPMEGYDRGHRTAITREEGLAIARELRELILPLVLERRSGEGDDLISLLWRAAPGLFDDPWDEHSIVDNVIVMWEGGTHSTAPTAATCLWYLAQRPDLQREIRDGGLRTAAAFSEEVMRLYGPTRRFGRVAARDIELGGVWIRKGELVHGLAAAAARDETHYACPNEFDLHRKGLRDHFTFGNGPRVCVGHGAARAMLATIVERVVERLPDLRLDPEAPPPKPMDVGDRAWAPVHVRFGCGIDVDAVRSGP